MFEVLLQADRALASGALDKAEQAYWQLVELDPTNAIATAGLARVALARGDRRLARKFADKALSIDPESIVALNVVDALEGRGEASPVSHAAGDLPLQAVQRLEAVGRKRAAAEEENRQAVMPTGLGPGGTTAIGVPTIGAPASPIARRPAPAAPAANVQPETPGAPLPTMPRGEPLKNRRQAGRKVASAAAAAAQLSPYGGRVPKRPVLGDRARRHLETQPKIPPRSHDAFSQAETAAAIEAVDQAEDPALAESPAAIVEAPAAAEVEAPAAREAEAAEAEAAEAEAAAMAEAQAAELEAAQAVGIEAVGIEAVPIEPAEAAEPEAAAPSLQPAGEDLDARFAEAELRSEELAAAEEASSQIAEAEFEADVLEAVGLPGGHKQLPSLPSGPASAEEASEEDAEAAALREALEMVLGPAPAPEPPAHAEGIPTAAEAQGSLTPSEESAAREPAADSARRAPEMIGLEGAAASTEGESPAASAKTDQKRKGLFGRLRGS